jgi:F-box and leucine-rich repeat protein 1 (S-phase kinase-associated protein 2)
MWLTWGYFVVDSDQSVIVLADNCLRLRVLGFHCCRNITDLAMYSLVNSNKRRETLRSNKRSSSAGSSTRVRELGSERYSTGTSRSSSFAYSSSSSSCSSNDNGKGGVGFDTSYLRDPAGFGLVSLNLSGCTALSAHAVQAVCDAFPQLHTCPERHSLITSGCLNLTTVRCICVIEARRERLSRAAAQPFHPRHRPL